MMKSLPLYWFNQTCQTQRVTNTVTAGSNVVTYSDNLTGISCRAVTVAGGENTGDRTNDYNGYKFYFNNAPDIVATDRIVFSSRVFDVVNVQNFDEAGAYIRCDTNEVQPSGVGA